MFSFSPLHYDFSSIAYFSERRGAENHAITVAGVVIVVAAAVVDIVKVSATVSRAKPPVGGDNELNTENGFCRT